MSCLGNYMQFKVYSSRTLGKVKVLVVALIFLDDTISSRPELAASSYTLVTSYPEKELKYDTQILATAELFNGFIKEADCNNCRVFIDYFCVNSNPDHPLLFFCMRVLYNCVN